VPLLGCLFILRRLILTFFCDTTRGQHTSEAHLDPTQEEDEIRANFLNEKLESYTLVGGMVAIG
jgi:hypothetical protein